jgi:tetratricopeptide (TPR) repeat protein
MEGSRKLDTARSSASQRALVRTLVVVLFLGAASFSSNAQLAGANAGSADIQQLFEQQRWNEVVLRSESLSWRSADVEYYYGSALAQLGRWDDAAQAFQRGLKLSEHDNRFPIELGGVAYKQKRYQDAAAWLRDGLKIDPSDSYANDFLATIYFVQGNLDAALKYWNRINKPFVEGIHSDRELRINPVLLDRAFAFAPAGIMRLSDYLTTKRRLEGLGVFTTYRMAPIAREDGKFDLNFSAQERNGAGSGKWQALLSIFRGLPYQTIYPEYFNIGQEARNFTSLVRWDAQKRRVAAAYSAPLEGNPKYRYQLDADFRDENWDIRPSFKGPAALLGGLNLRREGVGASLVSLNSGRWGWSMGAELSHRDYRSVFQGSALNPDLLLTGYQLKHTAELSYEVLRVPERRLSMKSSASSQVGAIWSSPRHTFEKLQGRVSAEWFPQMQGDDFKMRETLQAGTTVGQAPFDELFMLGLDRDNDLWMRAHIGTRDGRKGSAPLGRNYFLSNWEIDKRIYNNGIFGVKLSPFLDTGRINGPTIGLGSKKWLWDTGVQTKFSVLGVGITFTYGKDLRSGNNAFYVTTTR